MTVRVIAFVVGYVVAWKLTPPLAQWLLDTHKIQGVIVYPVAGGALFFGTGIVLNIASSILFLFIPSHIKVGGKLIGAFLGGFFGLVFGLLCVWTVGIVHNALLQRQQATDSATTIVSAPQSASMARQLAGKIISTTTQAVMGNTNSVTSMTTQLLGDPISAAQELNDLLKQPNVHELFRNVDNYRTMVNGTPEDIMKIPAFQQLVSDNETMKGLFQAGLAGNTAQEKQATLAKYFSTYTKNVDKIKNTSEYNNVMTDLEIAATLKSGNYMALLTNEKVRLLVEMIKHSSKTPNVNVSNAPNDKAKDDSFYNGSLSQKIYRWKDKAGGAHFSAALPEQNEVDGEVVEVKH